MVPRLHRASCRCPKRVRKTLLKLILQLRMLLPTVNWHHDPQTGTNPEPSAESLHHMERSHPAVLQLQQVGTIPPGMALPIAITWHSSTEPALQDEVLIVSNKPVSHPRD